VRSTLDPLTLTPLRNAVIHSAWGRGKIDLPQGIAKKLRDTPVYVGHEVRDPRFGSDLAKSMRVQRVSAQARSQKFKMDAEDARDNPQVSQQPNQRRRQEEQGRKQETDRPNLEAARGNKEAQRQTRQLKLRQRKASGDQARATRAQERATRAQEQAQRKAAQQPQGERVSHPARRQPPRKVMRPQPVRARPDNPRSQVQQRQPVQPRQQTPKRQASQTLQPNKHEARQQFQGPPNQSPGASKQERKHGPPAQPSAGQNAVGKDKSKSKP